MARWSASCETACGRARSRSQACQLVDHQILWKASGTLRPKPLPQTQSLECTTPTHFDPPFAKVTHRHAAFRSVLQEARVVFERKQERRELVFVRAEVGRRDQAEDDDDTAAAVDGSSESVAGFTKGRT